MADKQLPADAREPGASARSHHRWWQPISGFVLTTLAALQIIAGAWAAGPALAADDDKQPYGLGDANAPENRDQGAQAIEGSNGDMFMEEVVTDKPKPKPKLIPIDLSRVGVSVDPHGNIVPIRTDPSAPWAGSGVKPFYNHIETGAELPYAYGGVPYGGGWPYPGYAPGAVPNLGLGGSAAYGLGTALGWGLGRALAGRSGFGNGSGYSGFGYPGYGYPGFASPGYGLAPSGYPGYGFPGVTGFGPGNFGFGNFGYRGGGGYWPRYSPFGGGGYWPGYSPYGVGYTTLGNSATFISNDPVTGAPIAQGPQGNTQTNTYSSGGSFSPGLVVPFSPGLAPGAWLTPSTSWSQNSMWKAFNLAF